MLLIIAGIEPNPGPAAIKIGLLNARSTVNKGPLIQDIIINEQLDMLAVTETWIVSDDADTTKLDRRSPWRLRCQPVTHLVLATQPLNTAEVAVSDGRFAHNENDSIRFSTTND